MIILGIATASPSPVAVPGAGIFTSPLLLSVTIWVPVLAALLIATIPNPRGRYDVLMKQIAFFTNLGLLFVLFIAYNQFQSFLPNAQYEEKVPWLPAIGAVYHLGVDGPGMMMLILSGLVGISSVLASWGIRERVRAYFALLLLVQACVNGAIDSRDMFVLILFWGAASIPVALVVFGWGGPRREGAAWRLVAYWGVGTAALVVATMTLYAATGGGSFDMDVLLKAPFAPRVQLAAGVALIIAAGTRLPLFPFHGWARDFYAEAPVGVAVVVAGSASRLGGYLLLRGLVAGEPDAAKLLSPLVAALAAVTVAYAGLAVLRSVDLRHAAGHLAMVPGSITVLGFAALTPLAITGGVLSLFAGGLAGALFVGTCATVAERAQSRSLQVLRGLAGRMPKLTWFAVMAALALVGVPLMASFLSLTMTLFGSFKTQPVGAFAVAAGLAIVAVALAYLLHRVLFGAPNPDAPGVSDASLGETWFLGLLVGALLWVGIFPGGPRIPGTDLPLFDPGLMNNMVAGISDIASAYTGPTP
jgi:NADH-quinone oxidoreductase subunit M